MHSPVQEPETELRSASDTATETVMSRLPGTQPKIDFASLQRELLIACRGKISQKRLSARLGLRTNRVHRWESGEFTISWTDFVELCDACDIPLDEACKQKLHFPLRATETAELVRHLSGKGPQDIFAKSLGVSRSMVSRWRAGKVEPSLMVILQMIDESRYSLSVFVASLVGSQRLPSLKEKFEKEKRERDMHVKYPWVAALLLFLRTVEYNRLGKHKVGYLTRKLGISLETEKKIFDELKAIDAVEPEGEIFVPRLRRLNTTSDFEGDRRVRQYWIQRALDYVKALKSPRADSRLSYMILNTNPKTLELIQKRYNDFYQDVHSIIQASTGESDKVYLLNFQFIDIEDLPPRPDLAD